MNQTVAIIILILLGVAIISFLISLYNKLVMLKFNVEKAYGNIDVIVKQEQMKSQIW
jgi:LemA protein